MGHQKGPPFCVIFLSTNWLVYLAGFCVVLLGFSIPVFARFNPTQRTERSH